MVIPREEIAKTVEGFTEPGDLTRPPDISRSGAATANPAPRNAGFVKLTLTIVGLGVVYFVAAKLGLKLAFEHPSASSVWPGTGIALAALLLFGYGAWPGIFFGAFLANLTTAGSVSTSLGIGIGNSLEALIAARLVNKFAHGCHAFDRARDILKFALLAAILSTTVSATIGVTSLSLGKFIRPHDFGPYWFTWWLGDTIGAILLTPFLVLWSLNPRIRWNLRQSLEAAGFLISFILVNWLVFAGNTLTSRENYPLEFLCTPFFIWTAFRFGQRETAFAIVVLCAISIWGTLQDYGPFASRGPEHSLLLLQSFLGVTALMSSVLSAMVAENRSFASELLRLAVTDSLTGLANYRRFIEALDGEIKRAQRTKRYFAILLIDLDDLKLINDRLGHIAGNQALCRVAQALRASCRSIDTVARFGGDEFALILPEADNNAAQRVGTRVAQSLAADGVGPPISVSIGAAVYPADGERTESLISAADSALYRAKSRKREALAEEK
ncbi:MAG: MASE1 domain-containing protein [Chloroflexota bacterium]